MAQSTGGTRRHGLDSRIYDENLVDMKSDGIYRSLHYMIKYDGYYVEIQARTLFEEGWSEVNHDIVYPYFQDDEMLHDFSTLLNRSLLRTKNPSALSVHSMASHSDF